MKILLFGGSGQLGYEIEKRARDLNFEVVSPVISELDITEGQQVRYLTSQVKPDLIINCAAYTAVDKAETEREEAFKINSLGAENVAIATKESGSRLIHISTDYVFDGEGDRPLKEEDPTNPVSCYGESKLEGEERVLRAIGDRAVIVRTSSLHGQRGVNFVHTMLDLFATRDVVKVVNDQFMSPTWAGWLAEVLLDLGRIKCEGVVHASCAGGISWFDFAAEILELCKGAVPHAAKVHLEPISAKEFGRPARRPSYSVFDCTKLAGILGRKPIPWQEGLRGHLSDINKLTVER
jgi:dTDP-4-dehydrorhamnose reductase